MPLKKIKAHYFYMAFAVLGLILLVITKDLVHSSFVNYSFYLSESLLFGSFWLFFIPLAYVNWQLSQRINKKYIVLLSLLFTLLHISIFAFFVYVISLFFFYHHFVFSQTFIHALSDNGISCILIYGVSSFIFSTYRKQSKVNGNQGTHEKISVSHNNKTIVLDCQDILYIRAEKPYIAFVTKEKTYLHKSTLKGFMEEKASDMFIQIHKSTLVNIHKIVSYSSRKNGDYDVLLSNQDSVRASRSYNKHFKHYFEKLSLN